MRPTDTMACPVCGMGLVEDTSVPCESCGFAYPSARFFASPAAYSAWRDLATDYERESLGRVRARLSSAFALQGGGQGEIFLLNPQTSELLACNGRRGKVVLKEGLRAYAASGHVVAVCDGGGLEWLSKAPSFDLPQGSDFVGVSINSQCVFGIRSNGSVAVGGDCAYRKEVEHWRSVEELAAGEYHVAARIADGSVLFACSPYALDAFRNAQWRRDVVQIVSGRDCTLGLTSSGTVLFAGPEGDARSGVTEWSDVVSIAVEGMYAVGLTSSGTVLLAGDQERSLDRGRSEAAAWTDVVAIACGSACIIGLFHDGELRVAGSAPRRLNDVWPKEQAHRWIWRVAQLSESGDAHAARAVTQPPTHTNSRSLFSNEG